MKLIVQAFLIITVLSVAGCTRLPFQKINFVSFEDKDAQIVRSHYEDKIAKKFNILESAVFVYGGRKMTSLSYTQVDENNSAYSMTSISPQGVSLATVKGDDESLTYEFYLPIIKEKKLDERMIAENISRDLRRVYMNRLPSDLATVIKRKDRFIFKESLHKENCQWTFAGVEARLYEKSCDVKSEKVWTVRYFDYQERNSKIYPSEIYFENHELNYQVALRLKEILG